MKKLLGFLWFLIVPWKYREALRDRPSGRPWYWQPSSLTVANFPLALVTLVIGLCLFRLAYPLLERLTSGVQYGVGIAVVVLSLIPLFLVCLFCAAFLVMGVGPEWNSRIGWIRFPVIAALLLYSYFDMTGPKGSTQHEPVAQLQESSVDRAAPVRAVSTEEFLTRRRLAAYKWLEDVTVAGAHGPAGAEPPMLIVEPQAGTVTIENISGEVIGCVHLQRGQSSCPLESESPDCSPLQPGDKRRYRLRDVENCSQQPIEYRVGSLESPDVSWWSDSALMRWRRTLEAPETEDEFAIDADDERRRAELVQVYEQQSADNSRAFQWAGDQGRWQKLKAGWKMFRAGPSKEDLRAGWSAVKDDRLNSVGDVLVSNHFGPTGAIPKSLDVREDAEGVVAVENRSQEPLFVEVSRIRDRLSPLEPAHCELGGVFVSPGRTEYFASSFTPHSACANELRGALEFVIQQEGRLEWITTSRVHEYLDLDPLLAKDPVKQVKAERARRARQVIQSR